MTLPTCLKSVSAEEEFLTTPPPLVMSPEDHKRQQDLFVGEDEWQQVQKMVFFPVGSLKQSWDFIILLCVLFSCVTVPYRTTFGEAEGFMLRIEQAILVAFIVDLAVSFNTAYLHNERWVVHRPAICRNYLKGWFWVDAPASLPLVEVSAWLTGEHVTAGSDSTQLLRALRLFRLLRLLRVLKLGELMCSASPA